MGLVSDRGCDLRKLQHGRKRGMTTTVPDSPDYLRRAVLVAIEQETQKIVTQEAEEAAKRVRERVTNLSADIAANLVNSVSISNPFDGDLIVRMRTK
jgi:hypothetical protein